MELSIKRAVIGVLVLILINQIMIVAAFQTDLTEEEQGPKVDLEIIDSVSEGTKGSLFDYSIKVSCTGADCGDVKAYLDPKSIDPIELEDSTHGYIIEFEEKLSLDSCEVLDSENKNKKKEMMKLSNGEGRVSCKLKALKETHEKFKEVLTERRVKGKRLMTRKNSDLPDLPIMEEYLKTFNGMALNITKGEAEELLKMNLSYVKRIVANKELELHLDDTIKMSRINEVWNLSRKGLPLKGKGIVIANIDSGVNISHKMFGGCSNFKDCPKIADAWDFADNDSEPWDDNGHGTHTASISAGLNDGVLQGIAPEVKLYVYKVCSPCGMCPESSIVAAIERAVDPNGDGNTDDKADIISISLGGTGDPDCPSCKAINNAAEMGVISIVSAGNSGPDDKTIKCPACAEKAIAVGATEKDGKIADFSSRGPFIHEGKDYKKPEIVAPGVLICAARNGDWLGNSKYPTCIDESHVRVSGTSMAAPYVAGIAALVVQDNPGIKFEEFKKLIQDTAKDLGKSYNEQGAGLINPEGLFNLGEEPETSEPTPAPDQEPLESTPTPEPPLEPTQELKSFEKGLISTLVGAEPFYTLDNNPESCNLLEGESCVINWRVMSTGEINSTWEFFAFAEFGNETVYTDTINIKIVEN